TPGGPVVAEGRRGDRVVSRSSPRPRAGRGALGQGLVGPRTAERVRADRSVRLARRPAGPVRHAAAAAVRRVGDPATRRGELRVARPAGAPGPDPGRAASAGASGLVRPPSSDGERAAPPAALVLPPP